MNTKKLIGIRIKAIRTRKGFTQDQLAEKMGMGSKYISAIERGTENPTLNTLIKLSECLEVPIGEVFSFVELEDFSKLASRVREMIKEANDAELKMILKVVSAVIYQGRF